MQRQLKLFTVIHDMTALF